MTKIPCGGFKLDENFLGMNENDELSLAGGGEGKEYQYVVTDGEGNVKWEDRLAYVTTEEQVIFSQEDIAFTEQNGKYGAGPINMPETISTGEKYRVNFDGETYDCIAHIPDPGIDIVFIGNGSLDSDLDDTGEPFLIKRPMDLPQAVIITSLTNPTHTVSISRDVETVHKLPQKLLPDPTVFYYDKNDRLVDAEGIEMTLEQAKAIGLNFIIQSDSSVARPISALYDDTGVSFYVAKVVNVSSGIFTLRSVRVGIPIPV